MSELLHLSNTMLWSDIVAAVWRASWQGAIVLSTVWLLTRAWRTMPPLVRVWLWRVAMVKILVTLCWTGAIPLPALPRPLSIAQSLPSTSPDSVSSPTAVISTASPKPMSWESNTVPSSYDSRVVPSLPATEPTTAVSTLAPTPIAMTPWWQSIVKNILQAQAIWLIVMGGLWILGVIWNCASLLLAWQRLMHVHRACRPMHDPAVLALLAESRDRLGCVFRRRCWPARASARCCWAACAR